MPHWKKHPSIADFRETARRRMPRPIFDFVEGGAGDEQTLRANEAAFACRTWIPRAARDVSQRQLSGDFFGVPSRLPLALGPTGLAGLVYPDGDIALARAAARFGIPFCLSMNSMASLEEVARRGGNGVRWFQIYVLRDRGLTTAIVDRAAKFGYEALCVTVDLPVSGRRHRDMRNGFSLPPRLTPASFAQFACKPGWWLKMIGRPMRLANFDDGGSLTHSLAAMISNSFDPTVTWDDIAVLRDRWKGPLIIKGVLHPDDVALAHHIGADAVVVSNHGGRQLDRVPATLHALDALPPGDDSCRLWLDGGIRSGSDLLMAIASGAGAGLLGRAALWGLACGGQEGVERILEIIEQEFDNNLALLGCRTPDQARGCARPT